jgi:hypothetical protein
MSAKLPKPFAAGNQGWFTKGRLDGSRRVHIGSALASPQDRHGRVRPGSSPAITCEGARYKRETPSETFGISTGTSTYRSDCRKTARLRKCNTSPMPSCPRSHISLIGARPRNGADRIGRNNHPVGSPIAATPPRSRANRTPGGSAALTGGIADAYRTARASRHSRSAPRPRRRVAAIDPQVARTPRTTLCRLGEQGLYRGTVRGLATSAYSRTRNCGDGSR